MSDKSHIEWTNATWNPVMGCTRVSAGCDNCYAVRETHRHNRLAQYSGLTVLNGQGKRHFNGKVKLNHGLIDWPLRKRKPLMIFVNSMSDLFHKDVPFEFIDRVFAVMALCPQHTFQILTKRPERMAEYMTRRKLIPGGTMMGGHEPWKTSCDDVYRIVRQSILDAPLIWPLPNVWLGTSVEDQASADLRIPHLLKCLAAVRFLSVEPMLGPITFCHDDPYPWYVDLLAGVRAMPDCDDSAWDDCGRIHWVICGGESGPGARPMHPDWARSVRNQCAAAGVPFFFKQWGEWAPAQYDSPKALMASMERGQTTWIDRDGSSGWSLGCEGRELMSRVGKKSAGAMLDGRLHREWPQIQKSVEASP